MWNSALYSNLIELIGLNKLSYWKKIRIIGRVKIGVWEGKEASLALPKTSNVSARPFWPSSKNESLVQTTKGVFLSSRQKVTFGIFAKPFRSDILRNSFSVLIGKNTE